MKNLRQQIEALIFSSEGPVSIQEIIECFNKLYEEFMESPDIENALKELQEKYTSEEFAFELAEAGGGYQFLTKPNYHQLISTFLNQKAKKRLSTAAMETLAIIAYKQPVTKIEVEKIRGVSCDYTISKLLEKDLITIAGREDSPGQPIIYATSGTFMDYFGINSVDDLPKPKDLQSQEDNQIGTIEEEGNGPE